MFGFKNTQARRTARGRQTRSLGWYRFWSRLLEEQKKKKTGESLIVVCVCNANKHTLTLSLQRDSEYLICGR